MVTGQTKRSKTRVLLVTDDDAYSAQVKSWLSGIETLSLTEGSVRTALRAGLDVTRGVQAVLLDSKVSNLLQLRLYERLRPSDVVAHVPVIFARSKLSPTSSSFSHDLDFYQPEDASPDQTARLVAHVLGIPFVPPRIAARLAAPSAAAVASRGHRPGGLATLAPGFLQRLGLWGVAGALVGFTFWPLLGSAPIRDVAQVPMAIITAMQPDVSGEIGAVRRGR